MSLPAVAGVPISSIGPTILGPIDSMIMSLNSNPYFIGTMMLLLNLGGRFISMEITKNQEQFFQNPWVRRMLIFTVLFVGTRNVMVAFWMTLIIILLIGYLFNENSSLCLFHFGSPGSSCIEGLEKSEQKQPASPFTPEEAEIYKRLNEKQMRFAASQRKESANPSKTISDIYYQNMNLLNGSEGFSGNPRF